MKYISPNFKVLIHFLKYQNFQGGQIYAIGVTNESKGLPSTTCLKLVITIYYQSGYKPCSFHSTQNRAKPINQIEFTLRIIHSINTVCRNISKSKKKKAKSTTKTQPKAGITSKSKRPKSVGNAPNSREPLKAIENKPTAEPENIVAEKKIVAGNKPTAEPENIVAEEKIAGDENIVAEVCAVITFH